MGKIPRKDLVMSFGVRVPATYEVFPDPDSVDFSRLPSRFVLKPVNLWSSDGVHLLVRQGEQFDELMRQKSFSAEQVIEDIRLVFQKQKNPDTRILAEELVVGENGRNQIPFDYKFWIFEETVGIIFQVNRNTNPVQIAWFGPGFHPLPDGFVTLGKTWAPGIPVIPANAEALTETAKKISLLLDTPFCGIDLYTTGEDVYYGELSPTPGAAYFGSMFRLSQEFDDQMGGYWKQGCLKRGLPIPKITSPPPVLLRG